MHNILVTARFERDFLRIEQKVRQTILESVSLLKENPRLGKQLHGNLKGYFSLRCGDYRVIYTVDKRDKSVTLEHCGHRKSVYDRT